MNCYGSQDAADREMLHNMYNVNAIIEIGTQAASNSPFQDVSRSNIHTHYISIYNCPIVFVRVKLKNLFILQNFG